MAVGGGRLSIEVEAMVDSVVAMPPFFDFLVEFALIEILIASLKHCCIRSSQDSLWWLERHHGCIRRAHGESIFDVFTRDTTVFRLSRLVSPLVFLQDTQA